jgi:hypothetical protein
MQQQQAVGDVDQHVQALPDRRRQIGEPEVVAGRRHQEEDAQRQEAQRLEREPRQTAPTAVRGEHADQRVDDSEDVELDDREAAVRQAENKKGHAEMAPVVEQRQEAWVEPRQRPDRQDDM